MALITREDVIPSLIENTTMQKLLRDGVHQAYFIAPIDGYVLHDNAMDWHEIDEVTLQEGELVRGYAVGSVSCGANYDFNTVTMIDGYTAVGAREFFARPRSEVPEDQIFGGGNDHEVM